MNQAPPRIAIVTGASQGIGRAILEILVEAGHRVVVNARGVADLDAVVTRTNAAAGEQRVVACAGDAAERATIENMLTTCHDTFGAAPNLFVANAGHGMPGTVLSSDPERWSDLVRVNLIGVFWQLRLIGEAIVRSAAGRALLEAPHDIVILGSSIGRWVSPFNSVYGSTKSAIHSIAEGMRRELAPKGVRVTLIEPGIVQTDFQRAAGYDMEWFASYRDEIGPLLDPRDLAEIVAFIVSRPNHVHINDVMIRPTRQIYP